MPSHKPAPDKPSHKTQGLRIAPKRHITVSDLFTRDDVNDILANLNKIKPNINGCIVIYLDKNDRYSWQMTKDLKLATATWMLESTKLDILNEDFENAD